MIAAIILAGGQGSRFGQNKVMAMLAGKPVIVHTLDTFSDFGFDRVVVTANVPDDIRKLTGHDVIKGGRTRQESSYLGLLHLQEFKPDIVVIHDAVRPLVTRQIIKDSIDAARKHGAADVVIPATDTIVKAEDGFIREIPDRSLLYFGQTPQTFRFDLIMDAHEKALEEGVEDASDDCQLVLRQGHKVAVVEGSPRNMKLTHPSDLKLLEALR